jgi:2',3'-cyclic-nucleotide 2'-phosphodiesterase (5'-nucleotidase family)
VAQGLLDGAALLSSEPVHCGIVNAGNIRMNLVPSAGVISLSALHDTLAFANELVILELTTELLLRVLRTAVANLKLDLAGWLHTAGLGWAVAADGRIGDVFVLDGGSPRPLRSLDIVRVATLDYLADGGHQLSFLARTPQRRTDLKAADAWSDALRARRQGSQLVTLQTPPPLSSVDGTFRCTDTQKVLETLDHADPGAFDWAFDRLNAHLGRP